jgi:hypothetical protein
VLSRLRKWLVVVALVFVIGAHWAILQSAAWMGMIYNYSDRSTVSEAIEKTFSGQFPCRLCKFVREGKAAEKKQEVVKIEAKLDFTFSPGVAWLFPPRPDRLFLITDFSSPARFDAPLTPPPRAA